jgi:hypothetical protein
VNKAWLLERFVECAIAWGYCMASGKAERIEQADSFGEDLERLHNGLSVLTADAAGHMRSLMMDHPSPWVKYSAAAFLSRSSPSETLPVFEALSKQDGMWAPLSMLAVDHLKKIRH